MDQLLTRIENACRWALVSECRNRTSGQMFGKYENAKSVEVMMLICF